LCYQPGMIKNSNSQALHSFFILSLFAGLNFCSPKLTIKRVGQTPAENPTPDSSFSPSTTSPSELIQESKTESYRKEIEAEKISQPGDDTWLTEKMINDGADQYLKTTLTEAEKVGTPGHSAHGTAFDGGPRTELGLFNVLSRYLPNSLQDLDVLSKIDFPVSEPKIQEYFNQGLAQIHGFAFLEAERSFKSASLLAPEAPAPYWGMALANTMSSSGQPARALGFIQKADIYKAKGSSLESALIDALSMLYKNPNRSPYSRMLSYVLKLEQIMKDNPQNLETKALFIEAVWELTDNKARKNDIFVKENAIAHYEALGYSLDKLDKIIDEILAVNPRHPVHHYRIHLWDFIDANRSLESAREIGFSAPAIPHMWHMAGHTYSGLSRHRDAARAQESSARIEHRMLHLTQIMPYQIHNYYHNNSWLVGSYGLIGAFSKSRMVLKDLIQQPRHPVYNNPYAPMYKDFSIMTSGAQLAFQSYLYTVIEPFNKWEEIFRQPTYSYLTELTPTSRGYKQAARSTLKAYLNTGATKSLNSSWSPIFKTDEDKILAQRALALAPIFETTNRNQLHTFLKNNKELIDTELGIEGLLSPVSLLDVLIQHKITDIWNLEKLLNQGSFAVEHNQKLPTQLGYWAYKSRIHWILGQSKDMNESFAQLVELGSEAEAKNSFFKKILPPHLYNNGKWQKPRELPADLKGYGSFSYVKNLGPLVWTPYLAPQLKNEIILPSDIQLSALNQSLKSQPSLVVFHLGQECLGCEGQLKKINENFEKFAEQGIQIISISKTGPQKIDQGKAKFLELFDPGLETFREWGVVDEFDPTIGALHGLFLIVGGKVIWRDIASKTFDDIEFLLQESQRLVLNYGAKPKAN
jgi:peroxiredoxin